MSGWRNDKWKVDWNVLVVEGKRNEKWRGSSDEVKERLNM